MNCFDYLHLASSPSSWIDYSDITPVKEWWDNGGIVLAMWHWNVPKTEGDTDTNNYTSTLSETAFNIDNAFTEGTWEYRTVQADLEKMAGYLKLLHDANIPVIWRPLHEAAGGWFWWGKNADSFKKLWIQMFDYFKAQGLNNLIWVWTSETGDADWYPGDAYVDIIGRDLYGNDAADCASQYQTLINDFGNKMITLSECGYSEYTDSTVGLLSEQWNAGARWLWFMPWYDSDNSTTPHADQTWWEDAMSQDYVIKRGEFR
jgi:mannan endo-1,4-beta-mannosidase